jgi:hypothetical protein
MSVTLPSRTRVLNWSRNIERIGTAMSPDDNAAVATW